MENINQLLQKNSFAINELLRQHNIIAPDMQTGLRMARQQYGTDFMLKVFSEIKDANRVSNFSDDMGPEPPEGSYTNSEGVTVVPTPADGQFWNVWNNLLDFTSKTGDTVNKFRNDIAGTGANQQTQYKTEGTKYTMLYIVAGVVVLATILILIFKK